MLSGVIYCPMMAPTIVQTKKLHRIDVLRPKKYLQITDINGILVMNFSEWNEKKKRFCMLFADIKRLLLISREQSLSPDTINYSFAFWSNNMIFDVVEWHIAR